jgi:TP901 family phage tail tape measure protein
MADEQIVTRIVATADFSNLIADVHKVTANLSQLQEKIAQTNKSLANQIAVMNRSFSETIRSTGQFSTHFVSLTSDVEKFGKNLDSGRLKLRDYFRVYQDHARTSGGLIRDLAKQQVQLQNAVLQPLGRNAQGLMQFNVHIPRGLDATKNKAALLKQELQIMNKVIQDGGVQLINWGKNTQWAGRQLTVGLTLPLVAFGKAAADAFRTADQELTRLSKVYGDIGGATSQQLTQIRRDVAATAKELSAGMGVNFQETIALAADIAATGKTGNELLSSVSETTRLAVLGEVDRQEAMKATLAIQSAFKQNTEELAGSINFLNAVENQTSTTLNDLVEAIPKAGPVIKGLGGDVQDLALYLTAMREGGISASEGANALKSALASLINPTDVAVEKFQGFGIDLLGIVRDNAGDVTKTLFALQGALDRLDPLQKQQAIEQLFGKFQFSRLNALFENLGRQGSQTLQVLDLMKASAGELEAVAARELAAVTESASGRYRRAIEGLKAELAGVGEQFLNITTNVINLFTKVMEFVNNLPKPVKTLLTTFAGFTAIAGPVIMLTGLLANFFGYIIKGIGHLKALFKGAEGFKLLTPELLAAQRAAGMMENQFYSDARAASVLSAALNNLIDDLAVLKANASAVSIPVNPAVTTAAGTVINPGVPGGRVVDPSSPYLGGMGRASAHLNPRNPNDPATIFGFTLQPEPVNRRIGRTPQILMTERMPDIEGLTSVGGISTGVVAQEQARYQALMATLGMQSKAEVEALKKTIATGGAVSTDFIQTFDDILPLTQRLTMNAAAQSKAIVAELQAGKLTVDQAKAQIIAVNAQLEASLGQEVTAYAAARGRTIDLTKAPLIDQPVVDPRGKSNLRGMYRKGIFRRVMSAVGRATRTRTLGGSYSIETTRPQGLNSGGMVYMSNGSIVPGPNVNSDVVPAMLTPGEFVVNREATAANLPLLTAINNGYNNGGKVRFQRGHVGAQLPGTGLDVSTLAPKSRSVSYVAQGIPIWMTANMNQRLRSGDSGLYGSQIYDEFNIALRNGRHPFEPLITAARASGMPGEEARILSVFDDMMNDLRGKDSGKLFRGGTGDSFESHFDRRYVSRFGKDFQQLFRSYGTAYGARGSRGMVGLGTVHIDPKTGQMQSIRGRGHPLARGIPSGVLGSYSGAGFARGRASLARGLAAGALSALSRGRIRMNRGGLIPGYQAGGVVRQMAMGTIGYMGGSAIGGQIGGETGSMVGGMLGSMAPMLMMGSGQDRGLGGAIKVQSKFGSMLAANAAAGNKFTSTLSRVALGLTRTNLALGVVTAAAFAGYKAWQNYQENLERTRLSFGLTAESASKLGLRYKDYNTQIKDIIGTTKALMDRNKALYESMTYGGGPFKMTIADYKKLRKEVKETMGQQIDLINNTKQADLGAVATRLKTQFVAAGMSAEDASKKIYMAFNLSNKASQAYSSTLGNKMFTGITNAQTAAVSAVQQFDLSTGLRDAKTQANALNTALTAVDGGIAELIKTSEEKAKKDKTGNTKVLTGYQAEKQMLDQINSKVKNQKNLTKELINEMAKQNPEIKKFATTQDNVVSLFQKMRIAAKGFTGDMTQLTQAQTNALYTMSNEISNAVVAANKNGALKSQYENLSKLTAKQKELLSAIKGQTVQQQINAREAIKNINKEIEAIRKKAEERKKALREEQQDEDVRLQIQQKQLEYQDMLAVGNMSGAAQLQLEIERLVNQQQLTLTERAIDADAERRIAPLEAKKTALEEGQQKLADSAALASEQLNKINAAIEAQKQKINNFNDAVIAYSIAAETGIGNLDHFSAAVRDAAAAAGIANETLGEFYGVKGPAGTTTLYPTAPHEAGMRGISPTPQLDVSKILNAMTVEAKAVYLNAKDIFTSEKDKVIGSRPIPAPSSAQIKGSGALGPGAALVFNKQTGQWEFVASAAITDQMVPYNKWVKGTKKYGGGGLLSGPGTGTSDSILARFADGGMVRVSDGEYIINADTVSRLGVPFFDRINGMKNGGLMLNYDIPKYSMGGKLRYNDGGRMSSPSNNALYNINVNLNGSNLSPEDVARAISREMQMREAMNGRVRTIGG